MGVLAVIIVEVGVCLSALSCGAHVAISLQPAILVLPRINMRRVLDPLVVVLVWGLWMGVIAMAIWSPDRPHSPGAQEHLI